MPQMRPGAAKIPRSPHHPGTEELTPGTARDLKSILRPDHGSLASCILRMTAQPEDKASAGPTDQERLIPSQANGAGETPLRVLGTPESLLRLQRTWGVWQIPELDAHSAKALLDLWPPGSFLVIGHHPRQVLVLKTGSSPGEVNTYQIQKLPGGVCLESSKLCMPDLPHLLAFLSASRDILPRTLLLPPPTLGPEDQNTDPLQIGSIQLSTSRRVLFLVNNLYLETHRGWGMEQTLPETTPETAERHGPAPRNPAPHRVSWVEGPLSPEEHHLRPALASLVEEKEDEEEEDDKDDEEGPEDMLTQHVRALARARSSYVAKQFRSFRARLTSGSLSKGSRCQGCLRKQGTWGPPEGGGARPRSGGGLVPRGAGASEARPVDATPHAPRPRAAATTAATEPLGADAFLPALTEELIWSPDIGETQLDVEFLMELLDPDELRGEAGYYLTTWFGALYHIAHYEPDTARAHKGLSSEVRASLRQWHRRRTLHRQSPSGDQAKLPFEEPWAMEIMQETKDD
ncbi:ras and Rab interactor-like protein isoform X4 [Bos indicus]|uniref:Ras and Rab interactor-like protein isoform X4 n=1 Tax=Bos indicus TaxID=9915 RepID=A0ABM4QUW8_BOSIN